MAFQTEMPEQTGSDRSPPDNGDEGSYAERSGATEQTSGTVKRDALAASEARYRLAVDAARLGTWAWDVETDIASFDDRVRELLGLSDENARSRASIIESRIHPDDRERLNVGLMRAADPSGDGRFQGEYRIQLPDGTERWILALARMHFTTEREGRRAAQLIGTALDITDQKRAEARQRLL